MPCLVDHLSRLWVGGDAGSFRALRASGSAFWFAVHSFRVLEDVMIEDVLSREEMRKRSSQFVLLHICWNDLRRPAR